MYWAEALAKQTKDNTLAHRFKPVYEALNSNEDVINSDLIGVQGNPIEIYGYFKPEANAVDKAMRPSRKFNELLLKI
jgi:isocitrate dehydrogenase